MLKSVAVINFNLSCNCRTVRGLERPSFFSSHSCVSENLSLFNYRDASVAQIYTAPSLSMRS